jgi:hypothetical protein
VIEAHVVFWLSLTKYKASSPFLNPRLPAYLPEVQEYLYDEYEVEIEPLRAAF